MSATSNITLWRLTSPPQANSQISLWHCWWFQAQNQSKYLLTLTIAFWFNDLRNITTFRKYWIPFLLEIVTLKEENRLFQKLSETRRESYECVIWIHYQKKKSYTNPLLNAINFDYNSQSFNYGWWETLHTTCFPHNNAPDRDFHYLINTHSMK